MPSTDHRKPVLIIREDDRVLNAELDRNKKGLRTGRLLIIGALSGSVFLILGLLDADFQLSQLKPMFIFGGLFFSFFGEVLRLLVPLIVKRATWTFSNGSVDVQGRHRGRFETNEIQWAVLVPLAADSRYRHLALGVRNWITAIVVPPEVTDDEIFALVPRQAWGRRPPEAEESPPN